MVERTQLELWTAINTTFRDNSDGEITAAGHRAFLRDLVDTLFAHVHVAGTPDWQLRRLFTTENLGFFEVTEQPRDDSAPTWATEWVLPEDEVFSVGVAGTVEYIPSAFIRHRTIDPGTGPVTESSFYVAGSTSFGRVLLGRDSDNHLIVYYPDLAVGTDISHVHLRRHVLDTESLPSAVRALLASGG